MKKKVPQWPKTASYSIIKPSPIGCTVLTCGLFGAAQYLMKLCICQCLDAMEEHVKYMQTEDDVPITEQGRGRY